MAAPVAGACAPWIVGTDIDATACADLPKRTLAALYSGNILYRLSGRQYPGLCERTIRPCGAGCGTWARWPAYRNTWFPAYMTSDGGWTGGPTVVGGCCGACKLPSVTLPGPVAAITQVVVDGVIVAPDAYQVVGYRRLERLDGGTWPCTQNLAADSTPGGDQDTFQITYTFGRNPDASGITAATVYATEVAKYLCGNLGECQLPERTRSIVRQGISFELTTPLDFLDEGRTGVPLVDLWLRSVNPARLPRRATIRRLDLEPTCVAPGGSSSIGFYTTTGGGGGLNEAEVEALIAAHPDLEKVTYLTALVSGVPVDGWYLSDGDLASFTDRDWAVIWEGTAAQIPPQGPADADLHVGDLAVIRTTTL